MCIRDRNSPVVIPGPEYRLNRFHQPAVSYTHLNSKTTAVRVIPAIGLKEGEELDFGGLLGYGPVMPLRSQSPAKMINRGGRIPAPLQLSLIHIFPVPFSP